MIDTVRAYALNAKAAGLDGVVCSPYEAPIIKELGLMCITPGIRLKGDAVGDQKRVTSPDEARILGLLSDVLLRPLLMLWRRIINEKTVLSKRRR